jgi:hypothetical protein
MAGGRAPRAVHHMAAGRARAELRGMAGPARLGSHLLPPPPPEVKMEEWGEEG